VTLSKYVDDEAEDDDDDWRNTSSEDDLTDDDQDEVGDDGDEVEGVALPPWGSPAEVLLRAVPQAATPPPTPRAA